MKNKILITSIMIVFLISLIPLEFTQAQTFPAEAGQELTPSDIEVGLVSKNELWLKSGSRLTYWFRFPPPIWDMPFILRRRN